MQRESVVFVVVFVWTLVVAAADQTPAVTEPTDGNVTEPPAAVENTRTGTTKVTKSNLKEEEEEKEKIRGNEGEREKSDLAEMDRNRFFGRYTTTTEIAVVMVTSTVFFSCLSGTSAALCTGRRRKKNLLPLTELHHFDLDEK